MKSKIILLFAFVGAIVALSAFNRPPEAPSNDNAQPVESMASSTSENAVMYAGTPGSSLSFDYRKDTLTDAEINTLNIGNRDNSTWNTVSQATNFLSLYTYDIKLRPLSLSGTLSVKMVLDAANTNTGTPSDWCAIDSITGTTAARVLQLRSTDATASRYRLRVIGSGTQSSTYQIWSEWKRKN